MFINQLKILEKFEHIKKINIKILWQINGISLVTNT